MGKYAPKGTDTLDQKIDQTLEIIKTIVSSLVEPANLQSLLLFGGYGKGEGGVIQLDGVQTPHNNLDIMVVTKKSVDPKSKQEIRRKLLDEIEIAVDLSFILKRRSETLEKGCTLLLYELAHANHQFGGPIPFNSYVSKPKLSNVSPFEIYLLGVNRLTLFLINEFLKKTYPLTDAVKKELYKHALKGFVGCIDMLLFFQGSYHFSYQKKLLIVQESSQIPQKWKKIYERAILFRFEPNYTPIFLNDFMQSLEELQENALEVFFLAESYRLQTASIELENYFRIYRKHLFFHPFKLVIKRLICMIKHLGSKIPYLLDEERLGLSLPYLLSKKPKEAAPFLPSQKGEDFLESYLSLWGNTLNQNFVENKKDWERRFHG